MITNLDEVLELLGLPFSESGDLLVRCPFPDHEDRTPSFSVNFDTGLFHCFGCGRGGKLETLPDKVFNQEELKDDSVDAVKIIQNRYGINLSVKDRAEDYLTTRLLDHVPYVIEGSYAVFTSTTGVRYGRRFDGVHPTWKLLTPGAKDLFWVSNIPSKGSIVWLVEGIADAYALQAAGATNVAALCTNHLSTDNAYSLRGFVPLLLLDRDPAGFKGSIQCTAKLSDFEVPSYVFEIPEDLGSDPSEAYANDPDTFSAWIKEREAVVSPNEPDFLKNYFYSHSVKTCPTPFLQLNRLLGGGFKPGLHILTGEPKIGKTSLISFLSTWLAQQQELNIIVNTLEVPKMQMWARNAAQLENAPEWVTIEKDPSILDPVQRGQLERLAKNLRIVAGWSTNRLLTEADKGEVDVLIIDYIQRLPENMGSDDDRIRASLGNTAGLLSNYSRDKELITLAVSSIPRSSYGTSDPRPKGSGDIEFVCQSLSHLSLVNNIYFKWELLYNTRGEGGQVILDVDLGHGQFRERI